MKTSSFSSLSRSTFKWIALWTASLAAILVSTPALRAAGSTSAVAYVPLNNPAGCFDGAMGLVASYPLAVTSPASYPAGTSTTVTFAVTPTGLTPLSAVSDITITLDPAFAGQATSFTQPLQTIHYIVTGSFPVVALLPGITSLAYSYTVQAVGWPMASGTFDNAGHFISATSTVPPSAPDPAPTVVISTPVDGATLTYAYTGLPTTIPLAFTATASGNSPVISISADVFNPDGSSASLTVTPSGVGTLTASGTASIPVTQPGTYQVRALGSNQIGTGEDDNNFTIVVTAPPPTVAISSPTSGATFTFNAGTAPYLVPFSFTGTSGATTGTSAIAITGLTATLDGAPVQYTAANFSGLNTPVATAATSLSFTSAGSHTLAVTATDVFGGTATATTNFNIVVNSVTPTPHTVKGLVFFDTNFNGTKNTGEPGLGGVTVSLLSGSTVVASTVTATDGSYAFTANPGTYSVVVSNSITGLSPTTANLTQTVVISTADLNATPVGFGLNFCAIYGLKSPALSQGYWKNNVNKALTGKCGAQVPAATVAAYTTQIGALALAPFNGLTMASANTTFNGKSQLQLQLLAAEYNYVSGAYINGSKTLTLAFIYWGETVMQNTGGIYNSCYQTFAASWFAAYNTSEGSYVHGPLP